MQENKKAAPKNCKNAILRGGNVHRIYIDIIPQMEYNVLTMIMEGYCRYEVHLHL